MSDEEGGGRQPGKIAGLVGRWEQMSTSPKQETPKSDLQRIKTSPLQSPGSQPLSPVMQPTSHTASGLIDLNDSEAFSPNLEGEVAELAMSPMASGAQDLDGQEGLLDLCAEDSLGDFGDGMDLGAEMSPLASAPSSRLSKEPRKSPLGATEDDSDAASFAADDNLMEQITELQQEEGLLSGGSESSLGLETSLHREEQVFYDEGEDDSDLDLETELLATATQVEVVEGPPPDTIDYGGGCRAGHGDEEFLLEDINEDEEEDEEAEQGSFRLEGGARFGGATAGHGDEEYLVEDMEEDDYEIVAVETEEDQPPEDSHSEEEGSRLYESDEDYDLSDRKDHAASSSDEGSNASWQPQAPLQSKTAANDAAAAAAGEEFDVEEEEEEEEGDEQQDRQSDPINTRQTDFAGGAAMGSAAADKEFDVEDSDSDDEEWQQDRPTGPADPMRSQPSDGGGDAVQADSVMDLADEEEFGVGELPSGVALDTSIDQCGYSMAAGDLSNSSLRPEEAEAEARELEEADEGMVELHIAQEQAGDQGSSLEADESSSPSGQEWNAEARGQLDKACTAAAESISVGSDDSEVAGRAAEPFLPEVQPLKAEAVVCSLVATSAAEEEKNDVSDLYASAHAAADEEMSICSDDIEGLLAEDVQLEELVGPDRFEDQLETLDDFQDDRPTFFQDPPRRTSTPTYFQDDSSGEDYEDDFDPVEEEEDEARAEDLTGSDSYMPEAKEGKAHDSFASRASLESQRSEAQLGQEMITEATEDALQRLEAFAQHVTMPVEGEVEEGEEVELDVADGDISEDISDTSSHHCENYRGLEEPPSRLAPEAEEPVGQAVMAFVGEDALQRLHMFAEGVAQHSEDDRGSRHSQADDASPGSDAPPQVEPLQEAEYPDYPPEDDLYAPEAPLHVTRAVGVLSPSNVTRIDSAEDLPEGGQEERPPSQLLHSSAHAFPPSEGSAKDEQHDISPPSGPKDAAGPGGNGEDAAGGSGIEYGLGDGEHSGSDEMAEGIDDSRLLELSASVLDPHLSPTGIAAPTNEEQAAEVFVEGMNDSKLLDLSASADEQSAVTSQEVGATESPLGQDGADSLLRLGAKAKPEPEPQSRPRLTAELLNGEPDLAPHQDAARLPRVQDVLSSSRKPSSGGWAASKLAVGESDGIFEEFDMHPDEYEDEEEGGADSDATPRGEGPTEVDPKVAARVEEWWDRSDRAVKEGWESGKGPNEAQGGSRRQLLAPAPPGWKPRSATEYEAQLTSIMKQFTMSVLKEQPEDVVAFAQRYFESAVREGKA